jgi:hypothetical protein
VKSFGGASPRASPRHFRPMYALANIEAPVLLPIFPMRPSRVKTLRFVVSAHPGFSGRVRVRGLMEGIENPLASVAGGGKLQIPPLRFASVRMTKGRAVVCQGFTGRMDLLEGRSIVWDSVGQGLEARSRRMEGWGEFTWMRMLLLLW